VTTAALILVKAAQHRCGYGSRHCHMELPMPAEAAYVSIFIVVVFAIFLGALAWGWARAH